MILILAIVGVFVLGWLLATQADDLFEIAGVIVMVISGLMLFMALIAIPITHWETKGEIQQFRATESTIAQARAKGEKIETAAFMLEIAKNNQWLANVQYWNKTIFGYAIPDEVETLKPLQ